jgi:hypothetical protein
LPAASTKYLSVNFAAVLLLPDDAPNNNRYGLKSIDTPLSGVVMSPENNDTR